MNPENQTKRHIPWNKGKLIGQKLPLKLKVLISIQILPVLFKKQHPDFPV